MKRQEQSALDEKKHFAHWMKLGVDEGKIPAFGSIWFKTLPGGVRERVVAMTDGCIRFYSNLVQQCERRPHSPTRQKYLPTTMFFPDFIFPREGEEKADPKFVTNGGLAFHFFALLHPAGGILDLQSHVRRKQDWYLKRVPEIMDVGVVPVTETPEKMANYMFKHWRKGMFSSDDILLLPSPAEEFAKARRERRADCRFLNNGI